MYACNYTGSCACSIFSIDTGFVIAVLILAGGLRIPVLSQGHVWRCLLLNSSAVFRKISEQRGWVMQAVYPQYAVYASDTCVPSSTTSSCSWPVVQIWLHKLLIEVHVTKWCYDKGPGSFEIGHLSAGRGLALRAPTNTCLFYVVRANSKIICLNKICVDYKQIFVLLRPVGPTAKFWNDCSQTVSSHL